MSIEERRAMSFQEKIQAAIAYVDGNKRVDGLKMARNDAANLYASDYDEYCAIWLALGFIPEGTPELALLSGFDIC